MFCENLRVRMLASCAVIAGLQAAPLPAAGTPARQQPSTATEIAAGGEITHTADTLKHPTTQDLAGEARSSGPNPDEPAASGAVAAGKTLSTAQASASDSPPDASGAGDIVVTGSRIDRRGVASPTPVQILSAEDLREGARPNIAAALDDLPQVRATQSAATTGGAFAAGTNSIDLRGLGTARTLVLLDSRRFIGDNDLGLVPAVLVKRVDLVTGSASAAWGSGAVAGVVNLVLDDRFEGLRMGAQGSISSRGDASEGLVNAAAGASFANGRGHIVIGGEYVDNDGIQPITSRKNAGRFAVVSNPNYTATNGQHALILASDVGIANVSPGGLILSGVNAGKAFNPDGTLSTFDRGRVVGTTSIGGDAPSLDDVVALQAPNTRYALMGRLSYDFSDALRVSADIRHSKTYGNYANFPDASRGNITISVNNAFLPAAVRNQMIAAGQTSFTFGRFNADFATIGLDYARSSTQGTLAADGNIGSDIRWGAYYSHGEYDNNINFPNARITANFANAVDAVVNPATNQIVCRVALTNPTTNCVPINLFGEGVPSQPARAYVTGTGINREHRTLDNGGISIRGEPFALWAGPISFAAGIEARREALRIKVGPIDAVRGFAFSNFAPIDAANTTKEGFGELLIPLLRDVPLFRLAQFNGAARLTHDATGSIWSWKLGLTDEVVDGLQVRFVRSRDIRTPTLSNLFGISGVNNISVNDPVTGQATFVQAFTGGGNPNLAPETSRTISAGLTIAPTRYPRLRLAVDYFDIAISNSITSISAQSLVTRCFNGNQALCQAITRGSDGVITSIFANVVNLTKLRSSGIDATLDYLFPLRAVALPGTVRLRGALTRMTRNYSFDGISRIESIDTGIPKLRVNGTLYYELSNLQTSVRARYVSGQLLSTTLDIQNNRAPSATYLDVSSQYTIHTSTNRGFDLYFNINNVFDKAPPPGFVVTNPVYDQIGRYFSVGARARF